MRNILVKKSRSRSPTRCARSGFTLVELLVVIAIIVILATVGIPAVGELIKDNRTASQARELSALLTFARSEAIRRNTDVDVLLTEGGAEARLGEDVLRSLQWNRVTVTELTEDITFTNRGYLASFDLPSITMTHEDCRGEGQRRQFDIERTGQLGVTRMGCN